MADNQHTAHKYSDEELLEYLRNKESEAANALEKDMLNDPFLNDAIEGLQQYTHTSKIIDDVHDINNKIRSRTSRKKIFRHRTEKQPNWIIYISFIIIILLLIAYVVLK